MDKRKEETEMTDRFCFREIYTRSTFRHNLSYDDLGGTISPSENPDALLQDNVYYVRKGVPFVRKNMDGGSFTQVNDQILDLQIGFADGISYY